MLIRAVSRGWGPRAASGASRPRECFVSCLNIMMAKKQTEIAATAADSFPITEIMESNPLFTRREMLGIAGMAGMAALAGIAAGAVAQTAQKRPRIACLVSYWAAPGSHADWIITKLLDGYWWKGAHTPSRVDVVSVYIHQLEESGLGQKVCKSKGIPIFNTVGEAVTLGGKELAVDGVVIVGEHGNYPTNLKGQWLLAALVDLPAGYPGFRAEQALGARL